MVPNWDVQLTERLDATAGVRYEDRNGGNAGRHGHARVHQSIYGDWVGQVGLSYELTSDLHVVGSVSEGFRRPTWTT